MHQRVTSQRRRTGTRRFHGAQCQHLTTNPIHHRKQRKNHNSIGFWDERNTKHNTTTNTTYQIAWIGFGAQRISNRRHALLFVGRHFQRHLCRSSRNNQATSGPHQRVPLKRTKETPVSNTPQKRGSTRDTSRLKPHPTHIRTQNQKNGGLSTSYSEYTIGRGREVFLNPPFLTSLSLSLLASLLTLYEC
jgi:hypothetical protein